MDRSFLLALYYEYSREDVHDIFSPTTRFTPSSGTWGLHGIVEIQDRAGDFVFFVTFGQRQSDHIFDEWITEEGILSWQSQPRQTLQDRKIQQFIHHDESKNAIHLFLRTQRNTDYTYLGRLKYLAHNPDRENPVYIYWQLLDWPLPDNVLSRLNLTLNPSVTTHRQIHDQKSLPNSMLGNEVGFYWRGKFWWVNRDELINEVKKLIDSGLPEEATRFRGWYIKINEMRVSPKWLFHLITKANYQAFITTEARGKLAQIGLNAIRIKKEDRTVATIKAKSKKDKPTKDIRGLVPVLENRLESIRKILAGLEPTPSDEVLCDMVHFCYEFELYEEGQLLFSLVTAEQVNPWYFERTKKLARLCSIRSAAKDTHVSNKSL